MAKRISTKKFSTAEVQGDGSFVILSSVKVGEQRDYFEQKDDEDFDKIEWGVELLIKHIVDWNWVDDDGEPLPLPKDDPDVIDELTNAESELIAKLLVSSDTKN